MKSRSRILGGVAAKRVVIARFNIDEWSKPTMSSNSHYEHSPPPTLPEAHVPLLKINPSFPCFILGQNFTLS